MMSYTTARLTCALPSAGAGYRPPPHPLDASWRIKQEGATFGPYTGHELRRFARDGIIDRGTSVARNGEDRWTQAGRDDVLARIFCAVKVPVSAARHALA